MEKGTAGWGRVGNGTAWERWVERQEAPGRFELPNRGFADLRLTTWLRRRENKIARPDPLLKRHLEADLTIVLAVCGYGEA